MAVASGPIEARSGRLTRWWRRRTQQSPRARATGPPAPPVGLPAHMAGLDLHLLPEPGPVHDRDGLRGRLAHRTRWWSGCGHPGRPDLPGLHRAGPDGGQRHADGDLRVELPDLRTHHVVAQLRGDAGHATANVGPARGRGRLDRLPPPDDGGRLPGGHVRVRYPARPERDPGHPGGDADRLRVQPDDDLRRVEDHGRPGPDL